MNDQFFSALWEELGDGEHRIDVLSTNLEQQGYTNAEERIRKLIRAGRVASRADLRVTPRVSMVSRPGNNLR